MICPSVHAKSEQDRKSEFVLDDVATVRGATSERASAEGHGANGCRCCASGTRSEAFRRSCSRATLCRWARPITCRRRLDVQALSACHFSVWHAATLIIQHTIDRLAGFFLGRRSYPPLGACLASQGRPCGTPRNSGRLQKPP